MINSIKSKQSPKSHKYETFGCYARLMSALEIDQSGKIEQLNTHTVIAYSNSQSSSVIIRAGTKRKLIRITRSSNYHRKDIIPIIFGLLIFNLTKKILNHSVLVIDEEYTGKEPIIKQIIIDCFRNEFPNKKVIIRFKRVGKHSPAHKLAWVEHRNKGKNSRRITLKDIFT